jgi:hypothetical protein
MEMTIDIEAALQDRQLLGAALGDAETWATWLVALKAAFGIKLNRSERRTFASIAGSRRPPRQKLHELWAIAGRGSGKSRMSAAIAVYLACFQEHDLDPGEQGFVLVLAGSRDQAKMVFSYASAFLRRSPILRKMIANVTAFEIQLTNNVTIAVHSNSFRLIRGRTLLQRRHGSVTMRPVPSWFRPLTSSLPPPIRSPAAALTAPPRSIASPRPLLMGTVRSKCCTSAILTRAVGICSSPCPRTLRPSSTNWAARWVHPAGRHPGAGPLAPSADRPAQFQRQPRFRRVDLSGRGHRP